jgi:hypothetical protein
VFGCWKGWGLQYCKATFEFVFAGSGSPARARRAASATRVCLSSHGRVCRKCAACHLRILPGLLGVGAWFFMLIWCSESANFKRVQEGLCLMPSSPHTRTHLLEKSRSCDTVCEDYDAVYRFKNHRDHFRGAAVGPVIGHAVCRACNGCLALHSSAAPNTKQLNSLTPAAATACVPFDCNFQGALLPQKLCSELHLENCS